MDNHSRRQINTLFASGFILLLSACNDSDTNNDNTSPSASIDWTVSASSEGNGSITPTSTTLAAGSRAVLTLIPDTDYQISTVSGCEGTLSGDTYTTAPLTANCSVKANFAPIPTYTITTTAGSGGNITPSNSTVASGQSKTFTLTPNSGYQIASVSGCNGVRSGNTYTTAAITANCSITATFDAAYTITAIAGPGGSITPSSQTLLANSRATVVVTPDSNYVLDELSGCGVTADGNSWQTTALTADCTITASFRTRPAIYAGGSSTCALLNDNDQPINKCWGQNSSGQLGTLSFNLTAHGDETGEAPADSDSMTLVSGLSILSMDIGSQHACAIMSDKNLYCWGESQNGQLGIGTNSDQKVMNIMVGLDDAPVTEVSAGGQFTCARLFDGQVRCWGLSSSGELGIGSFNTWYIPPSTIPILADKALQISTGAAHACARLANNTVQCWGDNSSGQLGNSNGGVDSPTPSSVTNLSGTISDISAGGLFTCVIVDSQVRCWGENGSGQLGNNDGTNTDLDVPSAVLNLQGEVPLKLAAGGEHACVLTQTGKVYCWGESDAGQTGQNDVTDDLAPLVLDFGPYTVTDISAGGDHTCVRLKSTDPLITTHPTRCWGEAGVGQLGLENTFDIGNDEVIASDAFNVRL